MLKGQNSNHRQDLSLLFYAVVFATPKPPWWIPWLDSKSVPPNAASFSRCHYFRMGFWRPAMNGVSLLHCFFLCPCLSCSTEKGTGCFLVVACLVPLMAHAHRMLIVGLQCSWEYATKSEDTMSNSKWWFIIMFSARGLNWLTAQSNWARMLAGWAFYPCELPCGSCKRRSDTTWSCMQPDHLWEGCICTYHSRCSIRTNWQK